MLLTEQDVMQDLSIAKDKLRKLITEGKILAIELNPGSQKHDYRVPSQGLDYFKKGLSLEQVKSIVYQQLMIGGHGGDLPEAIRETAERQREGNELHKALQLILAGEPLTVEQQKILDAYHAVRYELLHTQDSSDLEKVTSDLQDKYRDMTESEVLELLANVRTWIRQMEGS